MHNVFEDLLHPVCPLPILSEGAVHVHSAHTGRVQHVLNRQREDTNRAARNGGPGLGAVNKECGEEASGQSYVSKSPVSKIYTSISGLGPECQIQVGGDLKTDD